MSRDAEEKKPRSKMILYLQREMGKEYIKSLVHKSPYRAVEGARAQGSESGAATWPPATIK